MFKRLGLWLLGMVAVFSLTNTAFAQSTNYQVLKYGTTQTSYADAYFVKPGDVSVVNGAYQITLTVATTHDLGRFPVVILNVNGQQPTVTKSTQGDTDYYTFRFTSASVTQTLSGNMKVDIDSINYHHTYGFDLKFDASQLPSLTASSSSAASQSSSNSASSQSSVATQNRTSTTAASSKETSSASSSKQSHQIKNQPEQHKTTPLWLVALGGLVGGFVVMMGIGFLISRKK
ncbi:MAG TPA: NEAT domain-containing protein [Lactobacillaceae bacterium]